MRAPERYRSMAQARASQAGICDGGGVGVQWQGPFFLSLALSSGLRSATGHWRWRDGRDAEQAAGDEPGMVAGGAGESRAPCAALIG